MDRMESESLNKRPSLARAFGGDLALKGEAQSGWPRMILLLFHLCHLINFLWQVLNKAI